MSTLNCSFQRELRSEQQGYGSNPFEDKSQVHLHGCGLRNCDKQACDQAAQLGAFITPWLHFRGPGEILWFHKIWSIKENTFPWCNEGSRAISARSHDHNTVWGSDFGANSPALCCGCDVCSLDLVGCYNTCNIIHSFVFFFRVCVLLHCCSQSQHWTQSSVQIQYWLWCYNVGWNNINKII